MNNNKGDIMMSDTHEKEMDTMPEVKQGPRGPTPEEQARFKKQELKQDRMRFVGYVIQGMLANHHYLQGHCKDEVKSVVTPEGIVKHAILLTDALIKEIEK